LLGVLLSVILFIVFSPKAEGISNNPCSPCHPFPFGDYDQYLDILEADSQTQIPSTLNKEETKTISLIVENSGNPGIYDTISGVSLRLTSKYGFFSINSETYSVGDMQLGKKSAVWQITGVSDGYDTILISATGINDEHRISQFSDSYSIPITVGQPTSSPSPTTTPTSTPTPTPSPTSSFSPNPTPTNNPTPTPTPTLTPTSTPNPSQSPSPSPTSPPSYTPTPESQPTGAQPLSTYAIIAAIHIMIAGLIVFLIYRKKK
jgi:hypothetical protein